MNTYARVVFAPLPVHACKARGSGELFYSAGGVYVKNTQVHRTCMNTEYTESAFFQQR